MQLRSHPGNSHKAKTNALSKSILTQRPRGVSSSLSLGRDRRNVTSSLQAGANGVSRASSESPRIVTPCAISPTAEPDKDKYNGVWSAFELIKSGMAESYGEIIFVLLA